MDDIMFYFLMSLLKNKLSLLNTWIWWAINLACPHQLVKDIRNKILSTAETIKTHELSFWSRIYKLLPWPIVRASALRPKGIEFNCQSRAYIGVVGLFPAYHVVYVRHFLWFKWKKLKTAISEPDSQTMFKPSWIYMKTNYFWPQYAGWSWSNLAH